MGGQMLGLISRFFGVAAGRDLSAELAVRLADFVRRLVAVGVFEPHLDSYLADPKAFRPPEGMEPQGLGDLPLEAQIYVVSLVLQGCVEGGLEDGKDVLAVTNHVLTEGGLCSQGQAQALCVLGLRLRGILKKDPADHDEVDQGLLDYRKILMAAMADAEVFIAEAGAGEPRPTPEEIEVFLERYVKRE